MQVQGGIHPADRLGPLLTGRSGVGDRLAGAPDAPARAGHDLHEIHIALARLDLLHQPLGLGKSVDHTHPDGPQLGRHLEDAAVLVGAQLLDDRILLPQMPGDVADDRLAHASGVGEDHPGAGLEAEGHIQASHGQLAEEEASVLDHPGQFLGRDDQIRVGIAIHGELGAGGLELLGGTGHGPRRRPDPPAGCPSSPGRISLARLPNMAWGLRQEEMLSRISGRSCSASFTQAGQQLVKRGSLPPFCLRLMNSVASSQMVRSAVKEGVVDLLEAQAAQRGDDAAHGGEGVIGQAEGLSHGGAHSGGHLDDHSLRWIPQDIKKPSRCRTSR